ncbi:MAG: prenylated flavin chaperone LpdD [Candidatus Hodarchaeales archaeon]|jgi:hypothetical protein
MNTVDKVGRNEFLEIKSPLQSFPSSIFAKILVIGNELLILLTGPGEHLGAVSMAEPYIKENKNNSASVSTITQTGHRDNEITSELARSISKAINHCVVVCGGIHIDQINSKQLNEIKLAIKNIAKQIIQKFNDLEKTT